jgi:hypothetical protein
MAWLAVLVKGLSLLRHSNCFPRLPGGGFSTVGAATLEGSLLPAAVLELAGSAF